MNDFVISNNLIIAYYSFGVCVFWEDKEGKYVLHRWEYYRDDAPKIFDVILSIDEYCRVCKIIGVDDI